MLLLYIIIEIFYYTADLYFEFFFWKTQRIKVLDPVFGQI